MLQYTDTDKVFYHWLASLPLKPERKKSLKVYYKDDSVTVLCKNSTIAKMVLSVSEILEAEGISLEIWVGKKRFFPRSYPKMEVATSHRDTASMIIKLEEMRSTWAKTNANYLPLIDGVLFLYSTDRDQGFRHLAVIPDQFGEKRLNKSSVEATLNLPLLELEDSVAIPRLDCIEQILATGEPQEYDYEHVWVQGEGRTRWRFRAKGQKVSDNEILIVVQDHPNYACWQKGFWQNYEG